MLCEQKNKAISVIEKVIAISAIKIVLFQQ